LKQGIRSVDGTGCSNLSWRDVQHDRHCMDRG
jgi:hypothetical protein